MSLLSRYVRGVIKEMTQSSQMLYPPGAGIVVVRFFNDGWRVLCLHASDYMDLPKGVMDDGEDVLTTALRETAEESSITDLQFEWGKTNIKIGSLTMFVASTDQDPKIISNPHIGKPEHTGASWLTWDDASKNIAPFLMKFIDWARSRVDENILSSSGGGY